VNEPRTSALDLWRSRLRWLRVRARAALPFGAGVLAALAALLLYSLIFPAPQPLTPRQVQEAVDQALASATPRPSFASEAYEIIRPSLVLIQTRVPGPEGQIEDGLGSGVVYNRGGDILTSLHVVAGASEVRVTFADGTQSEAQVAMAQPENDIAVLQASRLPEQIFPAVLGNPNSMRVGDEAYAVGNPFGLYSSMSAGVISGFERTFRPPNTDYSLNGLIQVDAAVNPGNSGGPLVNRYGQVVGIVVGIVNPTEANFFVGIGFAVPITTAGGGGSPLPY
jgi:S1-C subfamily serine protease